MYSLDFMITRCLCLLLFTLIFSAKAYATDAPEIRLRGDNELGEFGSDGLTLENLGIKVDIESGLAQVSLTATLRNDTDEDVEASFAYPLPEGAVINGYGLDIDDTLVDGVLMPKERAEALYTDRVTASVDPGIAARTEDNRYQTRIYPILAEGGTRSIRLDFAAPVPANGLRLPLSQTRSTEHVSIQISGDGSANASKPIQNSLAENIKFSGDIFIPAAPALASLSRYKDETFLTLPLAKRGQVQPTTIKSVAVIWDTSLSRETQDLAAQRKFVGDILAVLNPEKQSLIHGADHVNFAAPYTSPAQLAAALTRLTYDGATELSKLLDIEHLNRKDIDPDICLLISDGRSSLKTAALPKLPCRVFTFSAGKNPNTDWLGLLASRNNGSDLSGYGATDAARLIKENKGYQLGPDQTGEIFFAGNRHWLITPVDETESRLIIQFQTHDQSVDLRKITTTSHRGASSLWGQRRMAELRTRGPSVFDKIVKTSRHYGVQGKETAFLVLEDTDDYIEAKIAPPQNFPAARLAEYKTELEKAQRESLEERKEHQKEILKDWKKQIDWWKTDWTAVALKEAEKKRIERPHPIVTPPASPQMTCWDGTNVSGPSQCPAEAVAAPSVAQEAVEHDVIVLTSSRQREDDEVIVTGVRQTNPAGQIPSEIKVSVRDWTPDRPFLKALSALEGRAFESEYFRQRRAHGDRPSFYLEVADQLHRSDRTNHAAKMALTALDLPSATMITRGNIADRLLMYGQTETAILLYREILPTSQDRPQPHYNLALALIRAGDESEGNIQEQFYREAFEHLIHVINAPWEDDYEGIHLIALQDLNRTLARLPKRKRRKLQKELGLHKVFYRNLPVDVRLLVDWTSDDADLDIHVIERVDADDEEEAYYGNSATEMGGRISNDMTEGYGPEEYMIRRAPDGLYRVESDYYAQDDYAEDGALKLRARIWRNFGRKTETQNTVIIEMLEEKEEAYILGEIQVGPMVAQPRETE